MIIFHNTFVLSVIAIYLLACIILVIKAPRLLVPVNEDSRQNMLDFVKKVHERRAEKEQILELVEYWQAHKGQDLEDIMITQSSCVKEGISRHRHSNYMRANETAPNCGRKPRYKDRRNKAVRGMKERYLFDACRY